MKRQCSKYAFYLASDWPMGCSLDKTRWIEEDGSKTRWNLAIVKTKSQ
jgi:hypothetical protein